MTVNGAFFKGVGNIFKVFLENVKCRMEGCANDQIPLHLVSQHLKKEGSIQLAKERPIGMEI